MRPQVNSEGPCVSTPRIRVCDLDSLGRELCRDLTLFSGCERGSLALRGRV